MASPSLGNEKQRNLDVSTMAYCLHQEQLSQATYHLNNILYTPLRLRLEIASFP
jgi:hypothetical protein